MRYYVDNSSYFDSHPYRKTTIMKAVKRGGGTNIRLAYKFGWSNQPAVVTFTAGEATAKKVGRAVEKAPGTNYIGIKKKDW